MISEGHVTTTLLKQANKEGNRDTYFLRLHLKKFCLSIVEPSHSKLPDPQQYNVTV